MLVGLARILVWTAREKRYLWSCYKFPALLSQMLKKLHLEPKPAQCPGAVAPGGLDLPSLIIPGVSWEVSGTQDSLSNSYFAPTLLSLTQGMGLSSEEGRAMELCSSSFPGCLWSNKLFAGHTVPAAWVSVIPWFRGSKPWGVRQRNCDYWEKANFEGFSSVFRNRRYFRSNEKVHCWKKFP